MTALFNPVHRRGEPIKWGLVSYTVVMFSLVTVGAAVQFYVESISYVDNRDFPGVRGVLPPGPIGYQSLIQPKPISVIQNVTFALSNWLADGFLVSFLFDVVTSLAQVSNSSSSSSIVAMSFTPRTSGSSPSPVLCTLGLWVRF